MSIETETTVTPAQPVDLRYRALLLSPLHHGAGTAGNTALLRTQEVIQPDGGVARVPFVSGASIRHGLRDALAWHLVTTLDIPDGSLSKLAVDLIWSGGAVTTTGAEVDLGMARRVEEHWPALAMLGYAARSDIIAGTLRTSDAILVCAENAWRLREWDPPAELLGQRAAAFRGEEFGTRHDVASSPVGRLVEIADGLTGAAPVKTTQMIFDTQVLKAGAMLAGRIELSPAATDGHRMALGAALALWAPDGRAHLGAKGAQGYGQVELLAQGDLPRSLERWTEHVRSNGEQIMAIIRDLTA